MEIILSKNSPKDYRGVYLNQTEKKLAVSLCKFCGKVLINRNNIKKKKRYLSSIKVKTMLKFLRRFYLGLLL